MLNRVLNEEFVATIKIPFWGSVLLNLHLLRSFLPQYFVYDLYYLYNTNLCTSADTACLMALTPEQVANLLKLRALGWSQAEIAEQLKVSQQTVAYNLNKLKEQSKRLGPDEVFNKAMLAGLAGAAAGVGLVALLELIKNSKK